MVKQGTSLAAYVSQLSRRLSQVLPRALKNADVAAIHQARVTTRRLGATIDLTRAHLRQSQHKRIQKRLQQLRRLLGPLRDVDVMLAVVEPYRLQHSASVRWLEKELRERRSKARKELPKDRAALATGQLTREIVKQLDGSQPQFHASLSQMIRHHFDEFSRLADALAAGQLKIDVHSLRISGKKRVTAWRLRPRLEQRCPIKLGSSSSRSRMCLVRGMTGLCWQVGQ